MLNSNLNCGFQFKHVSDRVCGNEKCGSRSKCVCLTLTANSIQLAWWDYESDSSRLWLPANNEAILFIFPVVKSAQYSAIPHYAAAPQYADYNDYYDGHHYDHYY